MTHPAFSRRALLGGATFTLLAGIAPAALPAGPAPHLRVLKSPACGCCAAWAALARDLGYRVSVTDTDDLAGEKRRANVPAPLWACHTAAIDGYVIEGHVPFAAIAKLLAERPKIAGIAVPGMPPDGPGMAGGADAIVPVTAFGGEAGEGAPFPFAPA